MDQLLLIKEFVLLLVLISINTLFIMIIWNNVLLTKVKGAQLQKLNFLDALAIGAFFSIVYRCPTIINKCSPSV